MKKTIFRISALFLALVMMTSLLCVTAFAAPSASFSGSSSVQAGNSVTLTLSVSGGNIYGLSGTLNYGSGLKFTNYNCSASGWGMEVNGTKFSAYGTSSTSGAILTVTLQVDSSASSGTALSAGFGDIVVSDGESDISLGTASWSGTVAAAPSGDNNLASLSCSNATLSPAFSTSTTNYSCTVPFSVESLDLKYTKSDGGASVTVSGNSLVVGENTVTLTVRAANGSEKYYTISVTREQDPNYKASTDASLKELTIEGATLSPRFSPAVLEYAAYVPFETGEVVLHGVPHDEKAVGCSDKTVSLPLDGDNVVEFTCTAEDGTTVATYTIHVYRMPVYMGGALLVEVTDPNAEPPEPEIPTAKIPLTVKLPLVGEVSTLLAGGIAFGLVMILLFLLGFLIGRSGREEVEYEVVEEEPRPKLVLEDLDQEDLRSAITYELKSAKMEEELPRAAETVSEEEPPEEPELPQEEPPRVSEEEEADKAAAEMSLDDLLQDIRDL